jgi:hypothetical protein
MHSFEECRTVCAVNDAHVEVGAKSLDSGRRKLFSNEDNGLSHEFVIPWIYMRTRGSSLPEQRRAVLR